MDLEGTPEFNKGFRVIVGDLNNMEEYGIGQVEGMATRNGASMDPREPYGIDKDALALKTIEQYKDLSNILGHDQASNEMGYALGEYIMNGELNQFEADMIGVLAILGNVATNALNEVDRLRND